MLYQPGDIILNGKYRVERLVGAGAFGEVYHVTHLRLNAPRAIKVLRRDAPGISSEDFHKYRERFQFEAQLGAQLDHPNVVKVHDFEKTEDELYLVMEYAPGGSLQDRLKERCQLSVDEVVRLALDLCDGLSAIHERLHAVHRDLKPSNILFSTDGAAKIGDLGLAQVPADKSRRAILGSLAGAHPGTPAYMSPEQESTKGYLLPTSDIFSLGCVLFEALTGRTYKTVYGSRVREHVGDVPAWLDEIVARALAEQPGRMPADDADTTKRYRLARLMREVVERNWQAELRRREERPGKGERPRKPPAWQGWWLALVAALVAGGILFGAVPKGYSPMSIPILPPSLPAQPTHTLVPPTQVPVWPTDMSVVLPTDAPVLPTNTAVPTKTKMPTHTPTKVPTNTPVITPTLGPRVLFENDLGEEGKDPRWETLTCEWAVFNGSLYYRRKDTEPANTTCVIVAGDESWTDYRLEFKFTSSLYLESRTFFRAMVRYTADYNSAYCGLALDGSMACSVWKNSDQLLEITLMDTPTTKTKLIGWGPHHMAIEAKGSHYAVYLNGELLKEFDNKGLTHGKIGFVLPGDTYSIHPTYVKVTSLPY